MSDDEKLEWDRKAIKTGGCIMFTVFNVFQNIGLSSTPNHALSQRCQEPAAALDSVTCAAAVDRSQTDFPKITTTFRHGLNATICSGGVRTAFASFFFFASNNNCRFVVVVVGLLSATLPLQRSESFAHFLCRTRTRVCGVGEIRTLDA